MASTPVEWELQISSHVYEKWDFGETFVFRLFHNKNHIFKPVTPSPIFFQNPIPYLFPIRVLINYNLRALTTRSALWFFLSFLLQHKAQYCNLSI